MCSRQLFSSCCSIRYPTRLRVTIEANALLYAGVSLEEETMSVQQKHLAWHETMELHELVAFHSVVLIKLKKAIKEVTDPALNRLYKGTIQVLEQNLKELLAFYPQSPSIQKVVEMTLDSVMQPII